MVQPIQQAKMFMRAASLCPFLFWHQMAISWFARLELPLQNIFGQTRTTIIGGYIVLTRLSHLPTSKGIASSCHFPTLPAPRCSLHSRLKSVLGASRLQNVPPAGVRHNCSRAFSLFRIFKWAPWHWDALLNIDNAPLPEFTILSAWSHHVKSAKATRTRVKYLENTPLVFML